MSIHLIMGPMFSGKTTELLRRMDRFNYASKKILLIKRDIDTRYGSNGECRTHCGSRSASALCCGENGLMTIMPHVVSLADVVGIDEGQFFTDLSTFCKALAMMGKTVIISALDGDFKRKGFKSILELIPYCDEVTKLTAVCSCGRDAIFTGKKGVATDALIEVGGSNMYTALCRHCYEENVAAGTIRC